MSSKHQKSWHFKDAYLSLTCSLWKKTWFLWLHKFSQIPWWLSWSWASDLLSDIWSNTRDVYGFSSELPPITSLGHMYISVSLCPCVLCFEAGPPLSLYFVWMIFLYIFSCQMQSIAYLSLTIFTHLIEQQSWEQHTLLPTHLTSLITCNTKLCLVFISPFSSVTTKEIQILLEKYTKKCLRLSP